MVVSYLMDWLVAYLTHLAAFLLGFVLCAVFAAGAERRP